MQGFIDFTERWFYLTNHKYYGTLYLLFSMCGLVRVVIISDDVHRASGWVELIINLIINYTMYCKYLCHSRIIFC